MMTGVLLKEKLVCDIEKLKISYILTGIGAFAVNCVFAYLNYRVLGCTVGMWSNNYGNLLYFLGGAISGIVMVVCFAQLIKYRCIQQIGEHSIFYYGIHVILIEMSSYITSYIPGLSNDIVSFVASTVLVCIIAVILSWLFPFYQRALKNITNRA